MGFLLIAIGSFLILYSGVPSGENVFFVFPFFFSGSGLIGILGLVLFAVSFIIIARFMIDSIIQHPGLQGDIDSSEEHLQIGSYCSYCSQPILANSSFCSFCGNPIEKRENQSDGF
jgi:hypothetical protein